MTTKKIHCPGCGQQNELSKRGWQGDINKTIYEGGCVECGMPLEIEVRHMTRQAPRFKIIEVE